jgi:hypothetical protein
MFLDAQMKRCQRRVVRGHTHFHLNQQIFASERQERKGEGIPYKAVYYQEREGHESHTCWYRDAGGLLKHEISRVAGSSFPSTEHLQKLGKGGYPCWR